MLLVEEETETESETSFSSELYTMSETLRGDNDLLPFRPEDVSLSLPRFSSSFLGVSLTNVFSP